MKALCRISSYVQGRRNRGWGFSGRVQVFSIEKNWSVKNPEEFSGERTKVMQQGDYIDNASHLTIAVAYLSVPKVHLLTIYGSGT